MLTNGWAVWDQKSDSSFQNQKQMISKGQLSKRGKIFKHMYMFLLKEWPPYINLSASEKTTGQWAFTQG